MTKPDTFPALVARDGVCATEQADSSLLHDGAVTVAVRYSSVNYKDALAVTGKGKILRTSPMIPGIDYAGEVVESESEKYRPGDKVLLTGYGVGEKYSGGFAAYARANDSWLLPLPDGMDERQAMICGTAGLTAALCALSLTESGHIPEGGAIVVSGASGGVGSFSVSLLAKMGYAVTAISRPDNEAYLSSLGATAILSREEMSADARPLEKSRWAGAVDCVGGKILARILAEMGYGGVVAACGLAADTGLQTTVMPFIPARRALGRNRLGDDSQSAPRKSVVAPRQAPERRGLRPHRRRRNWLVRLAGRLRPHHGRQRQRQDIA